MSYEAAVATLTQHGAQFSIHEHASMRSVNDHEEHLPFDPARFLKVLAFRIGDARWALVALKGEDRLDYRALAGALGAWRGAVAAATPEELASIFECEPGGVCPIPARAEIEALLDGAATSIDVAYTGSSRSDRTLEIRMTDLLRIVQPRVMPLQRESMK